MRVCLLNDSFPPMIDGVVNVVMNYADYLMADHEADVIVGTPKYPDTDYSVYPYPVVPYQSFGTGSFASGYRAGNPFAEKAVSELADFKPEILHAHSPASATIIARILREATEAPIVFTYHTKYDIDIQRAVKVESVAQEGIRAMVSNIEACDEIWVVSRGAGENLKSLGFQGEYRVMNNGVDFAKGRVPEEKVRETLKEYDLPEGIPVYLFVGRMMTYKGLPLILDALKILADKGMDFRMVFVGKGPDKELLENKARELGLMGAADHADRCIFAGPVYDREVLRAWNTRADLFLFPSTFDTNGLVVREAAACGLASVLIRDSCAAEGITDGRNGFLIEETAESMAELLGKVSGDLPHLHEAGQHAMDEIYLSWQTCVSEAYDRYGCILEEKAAGRLPQKKKIPSDYLFEMTAYGMGEVDRFRKEQERLRSRGRERLDYFKQTAVGMMENFIEAEEDAEQFLEDVRVNIEKTRIRGMARRKELMDKLRGI